jgi:ribosomal protein S18 acetylase RimI-like enzyme
VRPVDPSERAASVLAGAFWDDPGYAWVFPDEATRAERLAWLYTRLLATYARAGVRIFMEAEDAVACWVPPGRAIGVVDLLRGGFARAPRGMSMGGAARALYAMRHIERLRARATGGHLHWYLDQLAVDPRQQGRGLGRRLLHEGLAALVDPAGLPCFLVTTKERNVAFYRASGFRVHEEATIGGFRAWAMTRTGGAVRQRAAW